MRTAILGTVLLVAACGTGAAAPTSAPPPSPTTRTCGDVARADASGSPLPDTALDQVSKVHDAACRRDYAALPPLMTDPFAPGRSAADTVAGWRAADPRGDRLAVLASTLETEAITDQGGTTFCGHDGTAVVFARGTTARRGGLSGFYAPGEVPPGLCDLQG
ncbi:hypothetical protein [Actinosynnema sp. NPDC020468]|uniref:hypothetical protein n=1 Tax=Actinosynnema sp. NPDC020468 TaxID=3154488 RepID=UPI0034046E38